MNRIIIGLFIFIFISFVFVSHLYSSYSLNRSDEFMQAKAIAISSRDANEVLQSSIFISTPTQYVFLIKDIEGALNWSFIVDEKIYKTIDANTGIAWEDIPASLGLLRIPDFLEIYQLSPGLVFDEGNEETPYYAHLTNSDIIWEIKGLNEFNKVQYTYLDFYSGQLIWNYQLQ